MTASENKAPETYSPPDLFHRLGNFLFRYRSYTPVPLAVVLVWQADIHFPLAVLGLVLLVVGELVRLSAVRSFGRGVRTRKVGAQVLITWGLFAHMRNPLYVGNLLLWMGVVLFAGGQYMPWLLIVALVYFMLQYALIISVEEAALQELFGDAYIHYCSSVPRVFPRLRKYRPVNVEANDNQSVVSRAWSYAFQHERSTLTAIIAVLILTLVSTYLKA
ncbi:MAG: DUF1295 domain-containing protein [Fidelibacterota bacterium]|nr:MAG: DUF1295 domain-containing protein [Candidatus Neomarinimicrobiota bacterium]